MVTVRLYGAARVKFGVKEVEEKADNVKHLLQYLAARFNVKYASLKQFNVFVNEVNISELKMYHTKLNDGDIIMLVSPASGG